MVNPTNSSYSGLNLPVLKSSIKQSHPSTVPDANKPPKASTSASVQVTLSLGSQTRSAAPATLAGSAEVAPVKSTQNPYANTILTHISGRLQLDVANGASVEDLQSRLEAGLKGFLQGYHEAADMLKHLGGLDDSVQAAIAETYHQVLNGISKLAEELGLEQPSGLAEARERVPLVENNKALPEGNQVPSASPNQNEGAQVGNKASSADEQKMGILESYQKAVKESETYAELARAKKTAAVMEPRHTAASARSFSFELLTADGNRVSIQAKAVQAGGMQGSDWVSRQSSSFDFSIEGELSREERRAITELLGDINQIAEAFFSGEVGRAFELAQNLGYDSDQISAFALNLNMSSVQRVSNTYNLPSEQHSTPVSPRISWAPLADFAQMVRDAGDQAEALGQQRSIVAQLAETLAQEVYDRRANAGVLSDFVKRFL